jgi:hypothetical protein
MRGERNKGEKRLGRPNNITHTPAKKGPEKERTM